MLCLFAVVVSVAYFVRKEMRAMITSAQDDALGTSMLEVGGSKPAAGADDADADSDTPLAPGLMADDVDPTPANVALGSRPPQADKFGGDGDAEVAVSFSEAESGTV